MRKVKIALRGALVENFQKGIEEVACYQIADTEERVVVTLERKRLHLRFQIAVDVAAAAAVGQIEVQNILVERVFELLELLLHSRNTERALEQMTVFFSRPPEAHN